MIVIILVLVATPTATAVSGHVLVTYEYLGLILQGLHGLDQAGLDHESRMNEAQYKNHEFLSDTMRFCTCVGFVLELGSKLLHFLF